MTRLALSVWLSVAPVYDRLVSAAVDSAALRTPTVAVTSAVFLSSASDTRGLVAVAVVALGAQPIVLSDVRRHSALRGVLLDVACRHSELNYQLSLNKSTVRSQTSTGVGDQLFVGYDNLREDSRRRSMTSFIPSRCQLDSVAVTASENMAAYHR